MQESFFFLSPEAEVADVAQWLDERYPYWFERIDKDTLDMMSGWNCIGGQLDRNWAELTAQYTDERGFETFGDEEIQAFATWKEIWIEEIDRRAAGVT